MYDQEAERIYRFPPWKDGEQRGDERKEEVEGCGTIEGSQAWPIIGCASIEGADNKDLMVQDGTMQTGTAHSVVGGASWVRPN